METTRTCIGCGKTMKANALSGHRLGCSKWQTWLEENKNRIFEECISDKMLEVSKKYNLEPSSLVRMLVDAGLAKPEDFPPSYTRAYPPRHKSISKPLSPIITKFTPAASVVANQKGNLLKCLTDIKCFLNEVSQLVSDIERLQAEKAIAEERATKYCAKLTELQNLLARKD